MISDSLRVTSEEFWLSGAVTALVDAAFVLFLIWRVRSSRFRQLKWTLAGTAAISWSIFGVALVSVFWDTYYRYFFPDWLRSGGVLLFVPVLYGAFALAFHWLAVRAPGNPIVTFCLLCGLESVLEHVWGIYGLKVLDVPLLQEASLVSILVFSFFEYIFYWSIIIGIAALVEHGWRWIGLRRTGAGAA